MNVSTLLVSGSKPTCHVSLHNSTESQSLYLTTDRSTLKEQVTINIYVHVSVPVHTHSKVTNLMYMIVHVCAGIYIHGHVKLAIQGSRHCVTVN